MIADDHARHAIGVVEIIRRALIWSAIAFGILVNAYGLATTLPHLSPLGAGDWLHLSSVSVLDPYATPAYRWAPPAIVIWKSIIEPMGFATWGALHVAAVLLLRPARLVAVTLLSWPFWSDVVNGNTLTFVVIATVWATRGQSTLPFFALALLMPRPLMLPPLLWILWKRPDRRTEFLLVFCIVILASIPHLTEWVARLETTAPLEVVQQFNLGPSRVVGLWWMVIGVPVGAWLLFHRRVGLAGLAWSPYWLSYYLLVPLVDWHPDAHDRPAKMSGSAVHPLDPSTDGSIGATWPPSSGGTARP